MTHCKFDACAMLYMCLVNLPAQPLAVRCNKPNHYPTVLHHRSCLAPAAGRKAAFNRAAAFSLG